MNGKKLNIGLFGFGTVGRGLYDVLQRIGTKNVEIKRICVRDIRKPRAVEADFTDKANDIFNDPDINFIVELIDDAEAAYTIVKRALQSRLPVVSGNKKMLAYHIEELIALQSQYNVALLYDASACGSIPVIRNLEEYYDNDLLTSVKGILNGSSNFILSKIFNEKMSYADALKLAQDLGFAESNPTLDIDGWDSLFKLIIITVHAFGLYVAPEKIFTYGISNMNDDDIRFANEKERRFKLVAHVEKIAGNRLIMCVMPQLISRNKYIYSCLYDYKYEYKKRNDSQLPEFTNDHYFRVYYRYANDSDLALIPFESISEKYSSDSYKYVVGRASLGALHDVQEQLRRRNVFIAAYPND